MNQVHQGVRRIPRRESKQVAPNMLSSWVLWGLDVVMGARKARGGLKTRSALTAPRQPLRARRPLPATMGASHASGGEPPCDEAEAEASHGTCVVGRSIVAPKPYLRRIIFDLGRIAVVLRTNIRAPLLCVLMQGLTLQHPC